MTLSVHQWKTCYRVADHESAQRASVLDRELRTAVAPRVLGRIDEIFDRLGFGEVRRPSTEHSSSEAAERLTEPRFDLLADRAEQLPGSYTPSDVEPGEGGGTLDSRQDVEASKTDEVREQLPGLPRQEWHWVRCAGLLFLLRPLLRGPWMQPQVRGELAERLYGFGAALLTELVQRLPGVERKIAWEREAPLLLVLSGLSSEPDSPSKRLRADIEAQLENLEAELPDSLQISGGSLRALLGADAWPHPEFRWPKLAAVALRRGALAHGDHRVELHLGLSGVDLTIRRLGLDVDPGWVPWIGRSIRFVYHDETSAAWRLHGGAR